MSYYELNAADLDRWLTTPPDDDQDWDGDDEGYMCGWCLTVHYEPCDLSHEAQAQINELRMTADYYDGGQCEGWGCVDGCVDCDPRAGELPMDGSDSHEYGEC